MKVGDVIQISDKTQMLSVLLYSLHKATINKLDKTMHLFETIWEKTDGVFVVMAIRNDTVDFVTSDFFDSDSDNAMQITLPRVDMLYKSI